MLTRTLKSHECETNNHSAADFSQKHGGDLYENKELLQEHYTDILFFKIL